MDYLRQHKIRKLDFIILTHHLEGSQYGELAGYYQTQVHEQSSYGVLRAGMPGKPDPWTLEKLTRRNIRIYRTDRDGSIHLELRPDRTWKISKEK